MATSKPPLRFLVTGSRDWPYPEVIWDALSKLDAKLGPRTGILVHGAALGADRIASTHWGSLANSALRLGPRLLEAHPVSDRDWRAQGPSAGHRRNKRMVMSGPTLCLAFVWNNSPGASGCLAMARKAGIRCLVWRD